MSDFYRSLCVVNNMDESVISYRDAKMWATLCHLAGLLSFIGIPFLGVIAQLVIWLVKREEHPLIDEHGREALNFQISLIIYTIVAGLLCATVIGLVVGLPLIFLLLIVEFILLVIAGYQTSQGEDWRYPLTIRLL